MADFLSLRGGCKIVRMPVGGPRGDEALPITEAQRETYIHRFVLGAIFLSLRYE